MTLSATDVSNVYTIIERFAKFGQHSLIDTILENADATSMSQEMMTMYLDATLHERDKLKKRNEFFQRCSEVLEKRGEKKSRRFERAV